MASALPIPRQPRWRTRQAPRTGEPDSASHYA